MRDLMSATVEHPPASAEPTAPAARPGSIPDHRGSAAREPAGPRPDGPESARSAPPPAASPAAPNRVPTIVLGLLALAGLAFGAQRWAWGRTHVSTDDAQVEGHIIPTLARVAGYVTE